MRPRRMSATQRTQAPFEELLQEEDDNPFIVAPPSPPLSRRSYRSWLATIWDLTWRPAIDIPINDVIVVYCKYQLEIAPETGRRHIQALIVTDINVSLAMIKKLSPTASFHGKPLSWLRYGQTYVAKELTRAPVDEYFSGEEGTPPPGQGARSDLRAVQQAIVGGATTWDLMNEHSGVMARHRNYVAEYHELFQARQLQMTPFLAREGWQQGLMDILEGFPSRRTILWYCDSVGNVGKSYFADHYGDHRSCVVNGGTHSDIFHLLAGTLPKDVVFFDYPREKEGNFPYSVLEQLKNGRFTSGKYQSRAVRFRVPHVVVFANFYPDTTKMSQDRWMIKDLDTYVIE